MKIQSINQEYTRKNCSLCLVEYDVSNQYGTMNAENIVVNWKLWSEIYRKSARSWLILKVCCICMIINDHIFSVTLKKKIITLIIEFLSSFLRFSTCSIWSLKCQIAATFIERNSPLLSDSLNRNLKHITPNETRIFQIDGIKISKMRGKILIKNIN